MSAIPVADKLRLVRFSAMSEFRKVLAAVYASPLYRWRFARGPADKLLVAPQDLRTADPTFAAEVLEGRFVFAGTSVNIGSRSPFRVEPPNEDWARELHSFTWLRHMRAADTAVARAQAKSLVSDWITQCNVKDRVGWQPDATAHRLVSWFCHSPIILEEADHSFYRRLLRSLSYQARYLRHVAADLPDGLPRLSATVALCFAGLCLSGQSRFLKLSTRWLEDEIRRQILPDGGVISRDPSVLLDLLLVFLPLRQTFAARSVQPPEALTTAIERMMPMLRFFRHGDGEVGSFNGTKPFYPDAMATVLAYDDARGRPVMNAQHSGYQRIEAGETVLLMDAGPPPPLSVSAHAHAGCLSFEFSAGVHRIITNCGTPRQGLNKWKSIARQTAAHSTATLDGQSSCQFIDDETMASHIGDLIVSGPRSVAVKRSDTSEGTIIDASHDGYQSRFGVIHQRRVVLDKAGTVLQGEDRFSGNAPASSKDRGRFAIRFHLHPSVRAASLDARRALLILPNSEGWVFSGFDSPITIEESVYLSDARGPMRTQQVVFDGRWSIIQAVSWELRKVRSAEEIVNLLDKINANQPESGNPDLFGDAESESD